MADLRRNGVSNRDMNCYYTESQDGDVPIDVLEGLHRVASAVLTCSDRGSQTAAASSARSIHRTPSGTSPRTTIVNTVRPSIQPLATSKSRQVAPSPIESQSVSPPRTNMTIISSSTVQPLPTSISLQIASSPTQTQSIYTSQTTTTSIIQQSSIISTTTISPQIAPSTTSSSQTSTLLVPVQSTQSTQTTLLTSIIQSTSPNPPQPSPSASASSSIILAATIPFQPLAQSSAASPAPQKSSPDSISSSGTSSELGSSSSSRGITSQAGGIVGGVIASVIIIASLLTLYFCRRSRRKQRRPSLGYMSVTPKFKPWKKKEAERRNTVANLEGRPNFDIGSGNREEEWRPVKPMKDRTVQFPAFSYAEKGGDSRPLTMPEPAFAPLRANRSSSLYSGSLFNSFPTEHLPPRARSAVLPPTRAGLGEGDVVNPFMTPSELLWQKKMQQSVPATNTLPRSDIYIARPYSVFDIADDDVKDRDRDSGISGLSRNNKSRRLSSPSSAASVISDPTTSRSASPSRFSQGSTYATSSVTQVQRALVTVRDLDADIRLSLDVDQEYGYRENGFRAIRTGDLDAKKMKINAENKLKNDIVVVVSERVESGGGLEEWEEREMERRRKEREKVRLYKGRIKPGMGVQKGGGLGALGVQRGPGGEELGVQKRWTGIDD